MGSSKTPAARTAKVLTFYDMITGMFHATHVCSFRDGLLWAAEHPSSGTELAALLRDHASLYSASCDPEFVDQSAETSNAYIFMLFRALSGMATSGGNNLGIPAPASLKVIVDFHAECCKRRALGRDLQALTQPLLASDLSATVGRETSRVMLENHSTSARRTHVAAFPSSHDARGKAPAHAASTASNICRDFIRGACSRTPCRYSHGERPAAMATLPGAARPAHPPQFPRQ